MKAFLITLASSLALVLPSSAITILGEKIPERKFYGNNAWLYPYEGDENPGNSWVSGKIVSGGKTYEIWPQIVLDAPTGAQLCLFSVHGNCPFPITVTLTKLVFYSAEKGEKEIKLPDMTFQIPANASSGTWIYNATPIATPIRHQQGHLYAKVSVSAEAADPPGTTVEKKRKLPPGIDPKTPHLTAEEQSQPADQPSPASDSKASFWSRQNPGTGKSAEKKSGFWSNGNGANTIPK